MRGGRLREAVALDRCSLRVVLPYLNSENAFSGAWIKSKTF